LDLSLSVTTNDPILLFADHKWRDLPGLALLKVILEDDYGVPVRVVSYHRWPAALMVFRPVVVCPTTMTGPREQAIARIARRMGVAVVVIPSEGIPVEREIMSIVACTHVDLSPVDLWIGWSDVVRDFQIERGALAPDRVVTTGVNRFDFYVPPWRELLLDSAELRRRCGIDRPGPIVTWATNFGHAGYARTGNEAFLEQDWNLRGLTSIAGYSDPRAYVHADNRVMQLAHSMMREVFRRFPEVNFIVKTHPAERVDIYEEYLESCRQAGLGNVVVVNREYIGDILKASSLHIHRYCTTGIEAWAMGVPTLSLHLPGWHLSKDSGGCAGEAAEHEDLVSTTEEICERITHYLNGGVSTPAQRSGRAAHLRRWLHQVDGRSTERQARVLAEFVSARRPAPRLVPAAFAGRLGSVLKGAALMGLNSLFGRPFDQSLSFGRATGPEINELGYVDRVTRQPDVEAWAARLRQFRRDLAARGRVSVAEGGSILAGAAAGAQEA
jgi:surface carbohydrate biosynthesis protein